MVILHISDLHLNQEEEEYGFSILQEIVDTAIRDKAARILFCGDMFDSFKDTENLKNRFRITLSMLPDGCRVFYLPGNHEFLRKGKGDLTLFDFGKAELLNGVPFTCIESDHTSPEVEFLAIPYNSDTNYREWHVPEKKAPYRILLAHAAVPGMHFTGLNDEEGETAVFDPDIFNRLSIDYAAMGHIHSAAECRTGTCDVVFPGSARVWRKGEQNPRRMIRITVQPDSGIRWNPLILQNAGEYRKIELPLNPEGSGNLDFSRFSPMDYIEIVLSGVIEDENKAIQLEKDLKMAGSSSVRKLVVNRDELSVISGIASQALVKQFLEKLDSLRPDENLRKELDLWHKTRALGLQEIRKVLEVRK